MDDFTRISPSPRRETLAFIRAFARFYSPQQHNEADARRCAALAVSLTEPAPKDWWPSTGRA